MPCFSCKAALRAFSFRKEGGFSVSSFSELLAGCWVRVIAHLAPNGGKWVVCLPFLALGLLRAGSISASRQSLTALGSFFWSCEHMAPGTYAVICRRKMFPPRRGRLINAYGPRGWVPHTFRAFISMVRSLDAFCHANCCCHAYSGYQKLKWNLNCQWMGKIRLSNLKTMLSSVFFFFFCSKLFSVLIGRLQDNVSWHIVMCFSSDKLDWLWENFQLMKILLKV